MKNKISDLRDHLFETIEALKDKDNPMEIERAKAIAGVADVVIQSAKVEVELIKVVGGRGTDFIPDAGGAVPLPKPAAAPRRLK